MERKKIRRAAIGRFARFGDLYDITKDEFLSGNIFKKSLTKEDIFEADLKNSATDFFVDDSENEKFEKLEIGPELSLSIMSGLVELGGSAAYLKRHRSSERAPNITLSYTVRTKHQEVMDPMTVELNIDSLKVKETTHVVVGIDWGAKCNITCEYQKSHNEDDNEAKLELKAKIQMLTFNISKGLDLGANLSIGKQWGKGQTDDSKFSYHTNCDVSDLDRKIPTTFEDALAVAQSLPEAVSKINNGKGIPIAYILFSINSFRERHKIPIKLGVISKHIEEQTVSMCYKTLQALKNSRQQINDLVEDCNKNKDAVPLNDVHSANELLRQFEIEEAKFKSDLGAAVIVARSEHTEGLSTLQNVIKSFFERDFCSHKINTTIQKFDRTRQKVKLINELKKRHVLYIGNGENPDVILLRRKRKNTFAFYMDHDTRYSKNEEWQQHKTLFFRLITAHSNDKEVELIVIDCELQPDATPKEGMCIQVYEGGDLSCKDLLQEESRHITKCVIKTILRETVRNRPHNRVPLKIRCPKSFSGGCSQEQHLWICMRCNEAIDFGLDNGCFYCQCGKANSFDSVFRCTDEKHGSPFVLYDAVALEKVLSSLRTWKETNILILGETGVGKSTWINATANYLAFETLKDAIDAKEIKVHIPSQFSYTSEEGETKKIFIGSESETEVLKEGQSATRETNSYKFSIGEHAVRFIDTPGIGDVDGLEQDKKNFENILDHLSFYDDIHAICILLKPNESRLTTMLRFCITELLTHLHKSAAENIVFCFTNARSTFYRPGETLSVLKSLLKEYKGATVSISPKNQFCFDNEAFRFLACLKNGIQFNKQDIDTYSLSWERAVIETKKFLKHVQELTPHSIQNTVSLNNARRIILELSKPLAETTGIIQENIKLAGAKSKEFLALSKTTMELQDQLNVDALSLELVHLNYPRTVCTDGSCVEYVQALGNIQKTVYKQQCHEHCYLQGIPTETVNYAQLQHCVAMDPGPSHICTKCGHSWEIHMHMTYDLVKKVVRVIDENKQKLLTKEQDRTECLANVIKELEDYIQELKDEQAVITNICAQFGCYLKKNAITPFNDAIDSHLGVLISQEKSRPFPNESTIESLERIRKDYMEEKLIIDKAMEGTSSCDAQCPSEPGEVERLKENLFRLKHNGESLRKIFEEIRKKRNEYQFREIQCASLEKSNAKSAIWKVLET